PSSVVRAWRTGTNGDRRPTARTLRIVAHWNRVAARTTDPWESAGPFRFEATQEHSTEEAHHVSENVRIRRHAARRGGPALPDARLQPGAWRRPRWRRFSRRWRPQWRLPQRWLPQRWLPQRLPQRGIS